MWISFNELSTDIKSNPQRYPQELQSYQGKANPKVLLTIWDMADRICTWNSKKNGIHKIVGLSYAALCGYAQSILLRILFIYIKR
jgi:hypothetical protein